MLMLLQELDIIMYLYKYISVFLEYCLCGWHPRNHKIFYLMTLTQERQKKFYVDLVMVELPMRWHTIHFVCKFYELCSICSISVILFHLFFVIKHIGISVYNWLIEHLLISKIIHFTGLLPFKANENVPFSAKLNENSICFQMICPKFQWCNNL